jgi:act minimal PKS acyl carrier protein
MQTVTLTMLKQILCECAGQGEDIAPEALDFSFDDLGYDSLALLETAATIERDFRIVLSDETVTEATTPRILLALVNERLSAVAQPAQ